MPLYHLSYHTRNIYAPYTNEAVLEFMVVPFTDGQQEVLTKEVRTDPVVKPYRAESFSGFELIRFTLRGKFSEFNFSFEASVKKEPVNPYAFVSLPVEEERRILRSDHLRIDHYLCLRTTLLTRLPHDLIMPRLTSSASVFDFVREVNSFVHDFVVYDNSIADPSRSLYQTVAERRGVCQDYAHFMLAILRKNHIPARYVSGYLNSGDGEVLGAGAIHAWVQALIPGVGWVGFDPTNNLLEDHHYIKIAHGMDIEECPTLRGVVKGAEMNRTDSTC